MQKSSGCVCSYVKTLKNFFILPENSKSQKLQKRALRSQDGYFAKKKNLCFYLDLTSGKCGQPQGEWTEVMPKVCKAYLWQDIAWAGSK